jgi:hypothetical protein
MGDDSSREPRDQEPATWTSGAATRRIVGENPADAELLDDLAAIPRAEGGARPGGARQLVSLTRA